jgi:hypothetical protein
MAESSSQVEKALEGVDERKRATLSRLIVGTSFVVPVVASFAIDALTISKAMAQNSTSSVVPSDRRLKSDIVRLATLPSGLGLYRFKYRWSDTAYVGVMAQEVLEVAPQAVITGADGFYRVDYAALGLELMTYEDWLRNNPPARAAA